MPDDPQNKPQDEDPRAAMNELGQEDLDLSAAGVENEDALLAALEQTASATEKLDLNRQTPQKEVPPTPPPAQQQTQPTQNQKNTTSEDTAALDAELNKEIPALTPVTGGIDKTEDTRPTPIVPKPKPEQTPPNLGQINVMPKVDETPPAATTSKTVPKPTFVPGGQGVRLASPPQSEKKPDPVVKPKAPEKPVVDTSLPPLRTFESDMVNAVQSQRASLASIAIQSIDKQRQAVKSAVQEGRSSKLWIVGAVLFIILALGALGAALFIRGGEEPPPVVATPATLVFSERGSTQNISGMSKEATYNRIVEYLTTEPRETGTFEHVLFIKQSPVDPNLVQYLTTVDFINGIGLELTGDFIKTLRQEYMFGIHTSNTTNGFVILQPDSFQIAFAGMKAWEPELARQLYRLLTGIAPPAEILRDPLITARERSWVDMVVRNIDARVLLDDAGNIRMIYAFLPTKDMLIITTSEKTFGEVVTRLQTPGNITQ